MSTVPDQLFGSKTRVKLLKLFFSNPNRAFYVREITRKIEEQINSVRRELANLLSIGLITSDNTDNKLYYEVNQDYLHYDALKTMFSDTNNSENKEESAIDKDSSVKKLTKQSNKKATKKKEATSLGSEKSTVIELPEAKQWHKVGNVSAVVYSGAYTRDKKSPVDILIIGDVLISKVEAVIRGLEKEKNKELRYAVIETDEWVYRHQVRDKFWLQFMSAKRQVVLDKDNFFIDNKK